MEYAFAIAGLKNRESHFPRPRDFRALAQDLLATIT
jgi:hypothetical protein